MDSLAMDVELKANYKAVNINFSLYYLHTLNFFMFVLNKLFSNKLFP